MRRHVHVPQLLLAVLGALIAGYLTVQHARGGVPVCVSGSGGCATVAASPYATLLGVPVAAWGLACYLTLAVCAVLPGRGALTAGAVLALAGAGFSSYLTFVELFVIDAICQWCIASAAVIAVLAVTAVIRLLR